MKSPLLFLLCLTLYLPLVGQTITGTIQDLKSGEPLIGVNAQLQPTESTELLTGGVSDANGRFSVNAPSAGDFRLLLTYVGYKRQRKSITVPSGGLDLGTIYLRQDPKQLAEVVVKEEAIRAQQRGDTTVFNADAYKTNPEANAEDLIEKMPGVVVENGTVTAQGEQVQKVLVDGRPFFDNDVNAALKNIPAEIIKSIQVFDQESDQSQFTGFSDGETTKTINIVTRDDAKLGQFGKLYAGYGTDSRYQGGGNINIFNEDQRISLIGQFNNVNQQNFSAEDLVGVLGNSGRGGRRGGRGGPGGGGRPGGFGGSTSDFLVAQQAGIAETQAFGLNFSDKWGDKLDVTASYFFNHSDNTSAQTLNRLFSTNDEIPPTYTETNDQKSSNANHRISGRIDYKISRRSSVIYRPRLSFQTNDGTESLLGTTSRAGNLESESANQFSSDLSGLRFDNNLTYRLRFPKMGRTVSVNLAGGYNENTGENQQFYENVITGGPNPITESLDQIGSLDNSGFNYGLNLMLTEGIGDGMLMLNYRYRYQREDNDIETFDLDEVSGSYDALNELQSNVFENDYITHETGLGYNYRMKSGFFMARLTGQWAQLNTETTFPFSSTLAQPFFSLQPFLMLRMGRRGSGNNLRVIYRARAQAPTSNQLQEVLDDSNPLLLTIGNSALEQAVSHNLFARWNKLSEDRTKVFYGLIGGSFTNNYVGSATYLRATDATIFERVDLPRGSQLTQSTNLDGFYSLRALATYGMPFKPLKSNLNLSLETNFAQTPSLLNELRNESRSMTYAAGITLSSNISEKVDFTISTRGSFNNVNNTLQEDFNSRFHNQTSQLKLNLIFGPDLVFNARVTHQYFDAFTDDFDQNFFLLNLSLGKQLFTNRRGKIALSVFDALDQNNALQQNVTGTYVENIRNLVIQRYFMLTFSYQLRHFGKAPEQAERPNPWEWRRGG